MLNWLVDSKLKDEVVLLPDNNIKVKCRLYKKSFSMSNMERQALIGIHSKIRCKVYPTKIKKNTNSNSNRDNNNNNYYYYYYSTSNNNYYCNNNDSTSSNNNKENFSIFI